MKKLLLSLLVLAPASSLLADMRYDPVYNRYYSYPETPGINQDEYFTLWLECVKIYENIKFLSAPIKPSYSDMIYYCSSCLNKVGTPAALRLQADLIKNTVHLANGNFMCNIF